MRIRVGTSGYSYKEWKGSFYPEKLAAKDMLRYYAQRLETVEINNTFYRMPNESMLQGWSEQVPDTFAFVLKASRRITHDKKLLNVGEEVGYLMRIVSTLGGKLGAMLFQFPPFFKKDIARLDEFLALVPADRSVALEFRNATWFDDSVYEMLRRRRVALCLAEADNELEVPFVSTADWGYVRLRKEEYGDAELLDWKKRILAQSWERAFVFFKHEDAGKGPMLAQRFAELNPETP